MTNSPSSKFSRRATFVLALGGAASVVTGAVAQAVPIRAIQVRGTRNRDLARIAMFVEAELTRRLASRYVRGARGGAVLMVELTSINLPVNTGGRSPWVRGGGSVDMLNGRISLVGPRDRVLQSFPLLASRASTDASDRYPFATDQRLGNLAFTYAYWIVSKLD